MNQRFLTPLRYPGGKSKFAPFVSKLITTNNLEGGAYLEPYAGGAGVALSLLFSGVASHIYINDFDPAVYDFWQALLDEPFELISLIEHTDVNMDNWYKYKDILEDGSNYSQVERGFATFFLNRTNRSGILKAGVIGGKEQKGKWKLDARFNKAGLISRIRSIADKKSQITALNYDALDLLDKCSTFLPEKSLIYLDPPYYVKGQGLYRNFYEHDDHEKIKDKLGSIAIPWLVSYDDAPEIRQIYSNYRCLSYELRYTAQVKRNGDEVMFFSDNLTIPTTK